MAVLQNPSYDVKEYTSGSLPVTVTDKAELGAQAHGFRAVGSGTVTITTVSGNSRTITVNDGELVPVRFTAVTASTGITAVRVHVPYTAELY